MGAINKIRIGDTVYEITPQIGTGLQFGTSLNNKNTVYVNIGEAKSDSALLPETGISITTAGFIINSTKFTTFLKALGFNIIEPWSAL